MNDKATISKPPYPGWGTVKVRETTYSCFPIKFSEHGQMILAINKDGTFEFGEGLDPDDASRRAAKILAECVLQYILPVYKEPGKEEPQ